MKDQMKIAFYIMIAAITVLTIGGMFIGQPETQAERDAQEEYRFYGQISAEIYFLAIGLVFTSVTTGIGLILSSEESSRSRNERNLGLVGTFSAQLTDLKNREKTLKSKRDCDTYALNYVDLMDQIAFLCDNVSIPSDIAKYFENEFGYALNIIEWLELNEESTKTALVEAKKKAGENYDKYDKNYSWFSLVNWCHYPDKKIGSKNNLDPIEILDGNPLPQAMEKYESLPSDEQDKILEVITEYSSQISALKTQEKSLTTKNDCETYAANFVDEMDQIAFLYEKNTFPKDTSEYFVNDFEYALRMIVWLENNGVACELKTAINKDPDKEKKISYVWEDLLKQHEDNDRKIGKEKEALAELNKNLKKLNEDLEKLKEKNQDESSKLKEIEKLESQIYFFKKNRLRAYTWDSLIKFCKKENFEPLEYSSLPIPMREYEQLPDEEMDKTLDLIKDYGDKISTLTLTEKNLTEGNENDLACELYANSYIDLLDGIAFLNNKKALPEKVAKYFENNFCYALTLVYYLVKTEDAEQKELPIVIDINRKKVELFTMSCDEWLGKDLKELIKQKLPKIDNTWLDKRKEKDELEDKDFLNWAKENKDKDISEKDSLDKIFNKWVKSINEKIIQKLDDEKVTLTDLRKIIDIGDQYTWTDLMIWCRENNLTRYKIRQLPPIMRNYLYPKLESQLKKLDDKSKEYKKLNDEINDSNIEVVKKMFENPNNNSNQNNSPDENKPESRG